MDSDSDLTGTRNKKLQKWEKTSESQSAIGIPKMFLSEVIANMVKSFSFTSKAIEESFTKSLEKLASDCGAQGLTTTVYGNQDSKTALFGIFHCVKSDEDEELSIFYVLYTLSAEFERPNVRPDIQAFAGVKEPESLDTEWTPNYLATSAIAEMKEIGINLEIITDMMSDQKILFQAVRNNDTSLVAKLVSMDTSLVGCTNSDGLTALHHAARHGHSEMSKALLLQGANVDSADSNWMTALHHAARHGHKVVCLALLQHGADVDSADSQGMTAIHHAARHGHTEVCQTLLNHGADVRHADYDGMTALHHAARHGHTEVCQSLLMHGADVDSADSNGVTSLHNAAVYGHTSTISLVLAHGADIAAKTRQGSTPLHLASQSGYSDTVLTLCRAGADITAVHDSGAAIHLAAAEGNTDVVLALLDQGCDINLVDLSMQTPLMKAARWGHQETVIGLVLRGADPDLISGAGFTSLAYALKAEDIRMVEYLSCLTNTGLSTSLMMLARSQMEMTPGIKVFLARCKEEEGTIMMGLKEAAKYGNSVLVKLLTMNILRMRISGDVLDDLVYQAILTDSPDTCEAVLGLCDGQGHVVWQNLVKAAEGRKITRVRQMIDKNYEDMVEEKIQNLKISIIEKTADVLDIIPKHEEFPYTSVISQVIPLICQDGTVSYGDLLKTLHIPPVHYDSDCPTDCLILIKCHHMREVVRLVEQIKLDLSNHYPVFSFLTHIVVGSIQEQTKISNIDESDIILAMPDEYKESFIFDAERQKIFFEPHTDEARFNLKNFHPYWLEDDSLDCSKYFEDFLSGVHFVILELEKDQTWRDIFSLNTSFTPCIRCMDTASEEPECRRCRHDPTCTSHDDSCGCQIFTSPSLTRSKIGAVLHLAFTNPDGSRHHMDVDLSCPVLSTSTTYDGTIDATQRYLSKFRPVGWLEELRKLEDMSSVYNKPGVRSAGLKMRHISRGIVIPRQSLLFQTDETLRGRKHTVYVIMKVIRLCTDSKTTSYQMKFAVDRRLNNLDPDKIGMGVAIRRVMEYVSIKNKFLSVHPDLAMLGVTGVKVMEHGLCFVRGQSGASGAEGRQKTPTMALSREEEDSEETLRMAIAMSLGQEEDVQDADEEEVRMAIAMSVGQKEDVQDAGEEEVRMAIAMSLKQEEDARYQSKVFRHVDSNLQQTSSVIVYKESKMEKECLAHQERVALEKLIQKVLLERKVTVVKDEGFLTINAGPNEKNMTLKDVKITFEASKEWKKIKSDFYCIPTLEKRDFKIDAKELLIKKKYQKLLSENTAAKAEETMQKDKEFKQFEGVLHHATKLIIRDHIEEFMRGTPGVLFRSVQTDKVVSQDKSLHQTDKCKMENLSKLADLGIQIPFFNCQDPKHDHNDTCYRTEIDFILLYVDGDTLCMRLIEVKRPNTTPWATEEKLPSQDMAKKCLKQLEKGLDFILSMIPDIPSENIQIKSFSAFPETHCASIFCKSCQANIISIEDVLKAKTQPNSISQKLAISQDLRQASDFGLDYLLTLTSRLVGKASLLHSGNRDLSDPFTQEKNTMKQNLEMMDKHFVYLNPLQRDLLLRVNNTYPVTNFCFLGGSGTGKTQMGLAVIRKLISTHDSLRPVRIILASCQHENPKPELLKKFEKEFKKGEQIPVNVHSLASLMKELGLEGRDFVALDRDRNCINMYRMPYLVHKICKRMESYFKEMQIIFFLDEIVAFGNPMGLDWRDLIPGPSINLLLAFSPVSHTSGVELAIWEGGIFTKAREYIRLPTDVSFQIVRFDHRYRNSRSIQQFSQFTGKSMKKYLALNERPETDIVGEKPTWVDIADDKSKIKPALEHMKKYIENDKKNMTFLLYDKMLSKESQTILEQLKEPRSKGGFGWRIMKEELFHGSECDTVFYVGSGHLEAFTRARLKLFIVTFCEDLDYSWYKQYQVVLSKAHENGLVRKVYL